MGPAGSVHSSLVRKNRRDSNGRAWAQNERNVHSPAGKEARGVLSAVRLRLRRVLYALRNLARAQLLIRGHPPRGRIRHLVMDRRRGLNLQRGPRRLLGTELGLLQDEARRESVSCRTGYVLCVYLNCCG